MAEARGNGMHGIKKRYVNLKLSSNMVDLIINSWSKGTQKQYSPYINRCFDYCARHNIDPFDSSVNQWVEFLAKYFNQGVSYSVVNKARSVLSSVFPAENGTPFGNYPPYCKVIKRYV